MARHLDLFSGLGGFALGAAWAGYETVGFSEVEPYCCALLRQNFPGVKNYGDIRHADFGELAGTIDVLSGGFPCQPFSLAGPQSGPGDGRHLWPDMLAAIRVVGPAWVVGENVPGFASSGQLAGCLSDLETAGYRATACVVPAAALGAVHLRKRLFIVAHTDRARLEEPQPFAIKDELAAPFGSRWPYGFRRIESVLRGRTPRLPNRIQRLKALGNSVVPPLAELIFRCITNAEHKHAIIQD